MPIDLYSYHLGAADCFCEMVRAGVKRLALSHPCDTRAQRDRFLPDFARLCDRYGIFFVPEDDPLLTDLFPLSLNCGKFNALFYADPAVLAAYQALKAEKRAAQAAGTYSALREALARRYGRRLSYPEDGIARLLAANTQREP